MKLKRILLIILANAGIVASAFLIFLFFADEIEPTKLYINATDTENVILPTCVLSFIASGVYLSYRRRGDSDAARGGIVLAALPHAVIITALLFLVLGVTNHFNHAMDFLTSELSKDMMLIYAILYLSLSLCLLDCISERRK